MAEIAEAGYETLRDAIEAGWGYIELQTSAPAKIVRREIDGVGSGATLEARENDGTTIVIKLIVVGSDVDMPSLPVTAYQSVLKATDSDGADILSTEVLPTTFTFQDTDDQLSVYHKIEVPEQV